MTGMGQERPCSVTHSWSNDQSCPGTVLVPHPSGCHGKSWDSVFRRRGVCNQDSTSPCFIWMMTALLLHSGQGLMGVCWTLIGQPQIRSVRISQRRITFFLAQFSVMTDACHDCLQTDDHIHYLFVTSCCYQYNIVLCINVCYVYCTWGILYICEYGVWGYCHMSLCIFYFVMAQSFLPCEAGVSMPHKVSYGYLTGLCTLRISWRTALRIYPFLLMLHVGMEILFLCEFLA